ncbi:MAG: hypothetical protein PHQ32_05730 [Firmicutes bacterium]|nr:hypothetical protein [Bacillota bacterium]
MEENKAMKGIWSSLKIKLILGAVLLLGMGLVITNPAKAMVVNVGGGLWDYGVQYNAIWQQRQYSNYWHPNWHRSSVIQDTTQVFSSGTLFVNQRYYKIANSWSYAKIATYWYPWQWRSYYDYLNY